MTGQPSSPHLLMHGLALRFSCMHNTAACAVRFARLLVYFSCVSSRYLFTNVFMIWPEVWWPSELLAGEGGEKSRWSSIKSVLT